MRAHGEQAMLLMHGSLPSPDGLISTMHGEDGEFFGSTRDKGGNSNAILPMTTVACVPPFHSGGTHAERQVSAAPGSGSGADAGGRRLHTLVRRCLYVTCLVAGVS